MSSIRQRWYRWAVPAVSAMAAAGLVAGPATAASARGRTLGTSAETAPAASAASMTINPSQVGAPLERHFVGLSLEAVDLNSPGFHPGTLVRYLRSLGQGVLRIGGNSSDETFWTSTSETPPSWSEGTLTPASLAELATVARRSGWKVILGVNLKHYDPARAANEVTYASEELGSSLIGVEIGNEANYYYSSESSYWTDFESYVTAIRAAVPGAPIVGPDTGHEAFSFLDAFANDEAIHTDITELTHHWYPTSACDGGTVTIPELLSASARQQSQSAADLVVGLARKLGVPAAIDETNSVDCGGMSGVSDRYAAALWSLDYGLLLAREGISEANFHGTIGPCDGAPAYTPMCAPTEADAQAGDMTARPEYYGLLALHLIGTGNFVAVGNPDSANVRAYAVKNGGKLTVVLDDVQDPASYGPTAVTLHLGAAYRAARQTVLTTSSASGLAASGGITLGGHSVRADGTLPAPIQTPLTVQGTTLRVTVAPGSAAIITLTGGTLTP
jgi:hypothetical protein